MLFFFIFSCNTNFVIDFNWLMQTKKSVIKQNIFHYKHVLQVSHQTKISEGHFLNSLKTNKSWHLTTNNYKFNPKQLQCCSTICTSAICTIITSTNMIIIGCNCNIKNLVVILTKNRIHTAFSKMKKIAFKGKNM